MADFSSKYKERTEENQLLSQSCPEVMKNFGALHGEAIKDGALSKKDKELIALGIAIAVRCEGCILAHVKASLSFGANFEEISEVVDTAILMGGGPSTVYGGHALSIAKSLM